MSYCISPPSLQFGFFSSLLSNLLVLLATHQIIIVLYNWYLFLFKCTLPFETYCRYWFWSIPSSWGNYLNWRLIAIELHPFRSVPFPVIQASFWFMSWKAFPILYYSSISSIAASSFLSSLLSHLWVLSASPNFRQKFTFPLLTLPSILSLSLLVYCCLLNCLSP